MEITWLPSISERVVEPEDPQIASGVQTYLGDVTGLQRVLDHHKLDCKVQKDVLHEAMKIIYDYQQVVTQLVKQKHILEKVSPIQGAQTSIRCLPRLHDGRRQKKSDHAQKAWKLMSSLKFLWFQELAHRVRAEEKYPGLIQVKQEPIDEHGDHTLASETANSKKHRNVSPDPKLKGSSDPTPALLRESQSLIKA